MCSLRHYSCTTKTLRSPSPHNTRPPGGLVINSEWVLQDCLKEISALECWGGMKMECSLVPRIPTQLCCNWSEEQISQEGGWGGAMTPFWLQFPQWLFPELVTLPAITTFAFHLKSEMMKKHPIVIFTPNLIFVPSKVEGKWAKAHKLWNSFHACWKIDNLVALKSV